MPRYKAGPGGNNANAKKTDLWVPKSTGDPESYTLKDQVMSCDGLVNVPMLVDVPILIQFKGQLELQSAPSKRRKRSRSQTGANDPFKMPLTTASSALDNLFDVPLATASGVLDNLCVPLTTASSELDNLFEVPLTTASSVLDSLSGVQLTPASNVLDNLFDVPLATASSELDNLFEVPIATASSELDNRFDVPLATASSEPDNLFDIPLTTASSEMDNLFDVPIEASSELDNLFDVPIEASSELDNLFDVPIEVNYTVGIPAGSLNTLLGKRPHHKDKDILQAPLESFIATASTSGAKKKQRTSRLRRVNFDPIILPKYCPLRRALNTMRKRALRVQNRARQPVIYLPPVVLQSFGAPPSSTLLGKRPRQEATDILQDPVESFTASASTSGAKKKHRTSRLRRVNFDPIILPKYCPLSRALNTMRRRALRAQNHARQPVLYLPADDTIRRRNLRVLRTMEQKTVALSINTLQQRKSRSRRSQGTPPLSNAQMFRKAMDETEWDWCAECNTKFPDMPAKGICEFCRKNKENHSEGLLFSAANTMRPRKVPGEVSRITGPLVPHREVADIELDTKPVKKPFIPITPTVHTGFSFSIVHLLTAIRLAMVTPLPDDGSQIGNVHVESEIGVNVDPERAGLNNLQALTVQEIISRVKANPGDPCILETQEPLQDLIRGVLKIFSSKTAPLGAKAWKALVVYEKSTKSWSWIGPVLPTSSSDPDIVKEDTSPEAWGLPQKMLVKVVNSFANWLRSGQECLQQIGKLPPPPMALMQPILDEKERFKDLRAQKSLTTISPNSEEVRAYFRREELLRYLVPDRAFSYTAADGKKTNVAPLRRCGGKPTSTPRDHFMLKYDRPPHVTILCLVRDAAARLPGGLGTRADVCTLIRDSQYIVEDVVDAQVNQVVSGALDRLHYERDPCVLFDGDRKLWVYMHRNREEEDFDDDGTASTKKWKRQRKDHADQSELGTVTAAFLGAGEHDKVVSDLNLNPLSMGVDNRAIKI